MNIGLNDGLRTLYDITNIKNINAYKKAIENGELDKQDVISLQLLLDNNIAPLNENIKLQVK